MKECNYQLLIQDEEIEMYGIIISRKIRHMISYYRIIYSIFSNHSNTACVPLIIVTLITMQLKLNTLPMIINQRSIIREPRGAENR